MKKITLIAAMDKNRVIGFQGSLPWRLMSELQHFKEKTLGKPVIMGRKTFESLGGKTLVGREIRVVSHRGLSLEAALQSKCEAPELMIAGGGEIFRAALPFATHMILSTVEGEYPGDVFFPDFLASEWNLDREEPREGFCVRYYSRR
ncbi:MAG: dihydrofolate reductase [Myxococcaceae bacterium]|nr:dihydrofolate reductase [Myxococcaceae bacterium]MBH2006605.1 dihydrofolate reductase [Myxococcaceae bacterium]